jgi:prepilin-type N-terminal cleavage/methylation domain-containing protein
MGSASMPRKRRGLTLIEVLAALAILGIGASAWAGLLRQGTYAARLARASDARIQLASEQLARSKLWSTSDFRRRLGTSDAGAFTLTVTEVVPSLFDVVVSDSSGAELLRTTFFVREDHASAR